MEIVDTTCDKLVAAMEKQAKQERGEEPVTPFIDTIDSERSKDSTVKDLTDELFDTSSLNEAWLEAYNASSEPSEDGESSIQEGAEIRSRMGVAYFSAWKKALLKFYDGNSDIKAVYGLGMCFINIGAQSVEATRLVLSEPSEQPGV